MSDKAEIEMVTIPKQTYERMKKQLSWLSCLEAAGVDNWQGIEEAIAMRAEFGLEVDE